MNEKKTVAENNLDGEYNNKVRFFPLSNFTKTPEGNAAYLACRKEYDTEEIRCVNQFKQDLIEENHLENNSKKDLLFSKAWAMGHANGLGEVINYFEDLLELIL